MNTKAEHAENTVKNHESEQDMRAPWTRPEINTLSTDHLKGGAVPYTIESTFVHIKS